MGLHTFIGQYHLNCILFHKTFNNNILTTKNIRVISKAKCVFFCHFFIISGGNCLNSLKYKRYFSLCITENQTNK